jgi:hypothetical protein
MRTLKLRFPAAALPTLDTFLKHTKDARVFRRAQAVRNVGVLPASQLDIPSGIRYTSSPS